MHKNNEILELCLLSTLFFISTKIFFLQKIVRGRKKKLNVSESQIHVNNALH